MDRLWLLVTIISVAVVAILLAYVLWVWAISYMPWTTRWRRRG